MNTILSEKEYQTYLLKKLQENGYLIRYPEETEGRELRADAFTTEPHMLSL